MFGLGCSAEITCLIYLDNGGENVTCDPRAKAKGHLQVWSVLHAEPLHNWDVWDFELLPQILCWFKV